eukprot:11204735-Lingulodinium_polyedra.AAC.1
MFVYVLPPHSCPAVVHRVLSMFQRACIRLHACRAALSAFERIGDAVECALRRFGASQLDARVHHARPLICARV